MSQIVTGTVSEFSIRPGDCVQFSIRTFDPQAGKWGSVFVRCEGESKFSWNGESVPATKEGFLDLLRRLWACADQVTFSAKPLAEFYGSAREVAFNTQPA